MDYQILLEADYLVNADESERYRKGMKQFRKNVFRTASGIALLDSIFREELWDGMIDCDPACGEAYELK